MSLFVRSGLGTGPQLLLNGDFESPSPNFSVSLLARNEGILLDPNYTGKAMAGLTDDARHSRLRARDQIVFIHTGGTPALFAYRDELIG